MIVNMLNKIFYVIFNEKRLLSVKRILTKKCHPECVKDLKFKVMRFFWLKPSE